MSEIEDVLSYWIGDPPQTAEAVEERRKFWFEGSEAIDREVSRRFEHVLVRARAGELDGWKATPRGTLALLIVLDQFSRNLRRGTPDAFSHDPVALEIARDGYDRGMFDSFDIFQRMFTALPFRHAEDVDSQKRCVDLAVKDALVAPPHAMDYVIYSVDWARKHLDVIVRFGRFPHRNPALGRTSTPAEQEYLAYLKLAGQWL